MDENSFLDSFVGVARRRTSVGFGASVVSGGGRSYPIDNTQQRPPWSGSLNSLHQLSPPPSSHNSRFDQNSQQPFSSVREGFEETTTTTTTEEDPSLTTADFRDAYPRYPDINTIEISEADANALIDFRPYMNESPYHMSYSELSVGVNDWPSF